MSKTLTFNGSRVPDGGGIRRIFSGADAELVTVSVISVSLLHVY
jgi:hypothetical protein